jgi:ketosteroid isomerase-like protein
MNRIASPAIIAALLAAPLCAAQPTAAEKAVWSLEDSYWRYVQAHDLERYRTLWHSDFLGWPLSSPEPVRKEHITDWIVAHTGSGETLKSYDLERLVAQATGDYVTVTYRVRMTWVTKDGVAKPSTLRVIHTWIHNPGHEWQIISGMAAPPDAQGH